MKNISHIKTFLFLISTLTFSAISFVMRNILIYNYNDIDLKLFKIEYIKNYGAAFSILNSHTLFLTIFSSIILFFTMFYILKNLKIFSKYEFFFSSLLTAGIICNLIERVTDGFVTDYIRLNFVSFPIFNISDMFICIGAFMLICNILFSNDVRRNN